MPVLQGMFAQNGLLFQDQGLKVDGLVQADGGVVSAMGTGNIYFVDPANGSDNSSGKTPDEAFATIAAGEDALTANQNDILYYIAGATSAYLTEELVWEQPMVVFSATCTFFKALMVQQKIMHLAMYLVAETISTTFTLLDLVQLRLLVTQLIPALMH